MSALSIKKAWFIVTLFILVLFDFHCTKKQAILTIWIGGAPQEVDYWEKLIKEYEQSTGEVIQVVVQPTDSDQRRQGLVISLQAEQPDPDVFMMDVVWIGQFVKSNWIEPLDTYIEESNFDTGAFFGKVLNLADKYDSKLYALPVNIDGGLLYYRKDLLEKYNCPAPPQTWKQLVEYSENIQAKERLSDPNFTGFVWQGAQYEGLVCTFEEFISSNRGGIMNGSKIDLKTPQNETALKFMQDLIHTYKISPPNTYTEMKEEEVRQAFQRGDALFERNWPYAWKLHEADDSPVKGKVGIAPLPHFEGGESVSTLGGWHIGISKYSDKKQEAWKLIQFIVSYQTQKKFTLNLGWNPGRKDVYNDSVIVKELPHLTELREVFEHAVSRPNLPYYTQVSEIIQRFVNNCIAGGLTAGDALQIAQSEIDDINKLYGEN
jgi:multiple sugar transport system substrate-binding protein